MAENKGELYGDLLAPAPDAARWPRPGPRAADRLRPSCSSEPSLKPGQEFGAQHQSVHQRE